MTKFFVYSFKYDCDNAIMLKNALGGKRIKLEGSTYTQKADHVIINWGSSKCPYDGTGAKVINKPVNVSMAVNKSLCFDMLRNEGIPTPKITRSKKIADLWVKLGHSVVGRETLTGNNGQGIFFLENEPEKEGKLYSQYIDGGIEYRVNVYKDKLISIREKKRDKNVPESKIKSGLNGYFFVDTSNDMSDWVKNRLTALGRRSLKALGLDFGGLDVIYLPKTDELFVLEVNSAPELRGDAVTRLAYYIKEDYNAI